MKKLILGSGSPRRRELLTELGFPFEVRIKDTDETCPEDIVAEKKALFIARLKVEALLPTLSKNEILICADTVVIHGDITLNKPVDRNEAYQMLRSLSGKTHKVCTGVIIFHQAQEIELLATTEVEFSDMSDEDIFHYIDNKKPFDKAGSYGIQEWIGHAFVKRISGSYNNVVGLPTSDIFPVLRKLLK